MRRALAILLFGTAVTGTTLAGAGLVVAPHLDPPGTPAIHEHVPAAYRFPLFFLMRLQDPHDEGERFSIGSPLSSGTAALVLALLAISAPRLPRPARRIISFLPPARVAASQWRPVVPTAPPRASALRPIPAD